MLRRTGLGFPDGVPWGTHFCHIYETSQHMLDVLIPYLLTGLRDNELCIWMTADLPLHVGMQLLKDADPHLVEEALAWGHLQIMTHREWLLYAGGMGVTTAVGRWEAKLREAGAKGCEGVRMSRDVSWITSRQHLDDVLHYEAMMDSVIDRLKLVALCNYPVSVCDDSTILQMGLSHHVGIVNKKVMYSFPST